MYYYYYIIIIITFTRERPEGFRHASQTPRVGDLPQAGVALQSRLIPCTLCSAFGHPTVFKEPLGAYPRKCLFIYLFSEFRACTPADRCTDFDSSSATYRHDI
jgi:hypothetical protein